MELAPFVTRLRNDLADAAAAGGEETRAAAERLTLALDPATRMVLLEVLAEAATEISAHLDHDVVDVRLRGREPELVVTHVGGEPANPPPAPEPPSAAAEPEPDDDNVSRISLRLPESLKVRAEDAATAVGRSLNAWLVDAVRSALDDTRTPAGSSTPTRGTHAGSVRGWVS